MTKKKPGARLGRPSKAELERRRKLLQQQQQPEPENRIQLAPDPEPEIPTSPSLNPSDNGSSDNSEKSAGTDLFEAAVAEVGAEMGGEFAAVADPDLAPAPNVIAHEEVVDDAEWIKEIIDPKNVKLYLEFPFDGAALLLQKPHLSLKPHEVNLLAPLVRKWCRTLLESSENPEFAAFMLFVFVYGTRVGAIEGLGELKEWLPKLQSFLGLGTKTQD